ncbi:MAG: GldG family protein, partial [Bacteroidota bacterium]
MRSKQSVIYTFLAVLGIIVLVNILSDSFFMRLDWTEDNRYTLSNATKDILKSLDEVVTVTAYFSEDLPPNIAQTRRDFKDLLVEYGSRSKDMVVYEFKDPNKDEEIEQEAMKNGIQPVIIDSREKDAVVQKKAYLGAIIQMGERSEVMPFIQPGAAMEYDLSSAIKKLSVTEKLQIGLLQGHGEPPLAAMQQARSSLSVMYNVQPVSLSDTTRALNRFNTVAIIAPTDSFPESHLQQLDEYLAGGNNLFIAINRVEGDLQNATGSTQTTGLEGWLQQKGIIVEDNMVVDSKSASVQ